MGFEMKTQNVKWNVFGFHSDQFFFCKVNTRYKDQDSIPLFFIKKVCSPFGGTNFAELDRLPGSAILNSN
jgi:hypothetical protein